MLAFSVAMKILGRNELSLSAIYDNFTHDTTTYIATMASTLHKFCVKDFVVRSTYFNIHPYKSTG
jgi:hypothetical protein